MNTIITIARQYGSGGREVGKKLAEMLGINCYDRDLITMAAEKSGMSEEALGHVDEKAASSLLYTLVMGSNMYHSNVDQFNVPINDKLFCIQSEIIREIAEKESCVIVGRCADYVLEGKAPTLNVFIHSDMPFKVERSVREHNMDPEKAQNILKRRDKARSEHYRFYTARKWGELGSYDLCLDSGRLGEDTCVELIAAAYERLK